MLHVALYQPEIPPNTGNIIRLCANAGAKLHLIHPLGFRWDDKQLRRAGLDYHEFADIQHYDDFDQFTQHHHSRRIFACSTKGSQSFWEVSFADEDMLLMGPETRGLPDDIREKYPAIHIPMQANSRSLNLSNATAVLLYEAKRQTR